MSYKPLTESEVLADVRRMAASNKLVWSAHAEDRLCERGLDREQIKACLLKGNFVNKPYVPNKPGEIQYEFKMKAKIDSEQISVVASLRPEKNLIIITVIK